jgi:hypothetical protein
MNRQEYVDGVLAKIRKANENENVNVKALSFKQLQKKFQGKEEGLVEITNKKQAIGDIFSTTSCCWGAGAIIWDDGINTGWVRLAEKNAKYQVNDTVF